MFCGSLVQRRQCTSLSLLSYSCWILILWNGCCQCSQSMLLFLAMVILTSRLHNVNSPVLFMLGPFSVKVFALFPIFWYHMWVHSIPCTSVGLGAHDWQCMLMQLWSLYWVESKRQWTNSSTCIIMSESDRSRLDYRGSFSSLITICTLP